MHRLGALPPLDAPSTADGALPTPEVADGWLLPVLAELAGADAARHVRDVATASLWSTAVQLGVATDAMLVESVARRFGAPVADLRSVDPHGRDVVPEAVARRYGVVPVRVTGALVEVATSDPTDVDGERAVAFAAGRRVRLLVAAPARIAERLDALYAADAMAPAGMAGIVESVTRRYDGEAVGPHEARSALGTGDAHDASRIDDPAAAPIVQLVDRLVADAIAARASDVHLEPEEGGVAVRLRVDGVLREVLTLPRSVGLPLVSRVKIMSGLDIADRLRPQDGRARARADGRSVDLRVSTLPAAHGEKVVIRILDAGAGAGATFDAMGLDDESRARLQRLLDAREGVVLVTGPTGSGKTTTLYTALRAIQARGGVNVVTVEDPVEYRLPGIVQVQVHEKAGLTFAAALRSILRQDPDVVLVGEIRDRETAAIAVQASLTGHLVLSTLHTTDAVGAITRLADVGVEPYKLGAALRGVVAQRLLRRLCVACRREVSAPSAVAAWLPPGAHTWSAVGCAACGGTGHRGRLPVMEVLVADAAVARGVAEGVSAPELTTRARAAGMRTLWESGVQAVLRGDVSADELLRVLDRPPDESAPSATDGVREPPSPPGAPRAAIVRASPPGAADLQSTRADGGERGGAVTELRIGVVDVFVVHPGGDGWRVLVLRRAPGVRCTGAWEVVHGSVEPGERPPDAAVREVREETGLEVARLYNLTAHPFYLHTLDVVQIAVAFVAFVDAAGDVTRGDEHDAHEWLALDDAVERIAWPRARANLRDAYALLRTGNAGPVEDVLRVR